MKYLTLLLFSILSGCGGGRVIGGFFDPKVSPTEKAIETIMDSSETLTVFSAIGGLCIISGMILLVISRGHAGWRPIIGGILLVLLNYVISRYADWIFIPVIIATGCISAAWGWTIIRDLYKEKQNDGTI